MNYRRWVETVAGTEEDREAFRELGVSLHAINQAYQTLQLRQLSALSNAKVLRRASALMIGRPCRELAQEIGVSHQTVRNAQNGAMSEDMRAKTKRLLVRFIANQQPHGPGVAAG